MKKTLLTVAVILFLVAGSQAQFFVGPRAGVNFSNYSSSYGTYKLAMGINGGLTMKYQMSDHWGLRMDPVYTIIGAHNQSRDSSVVVVGTGISRTTNKYDVKMTTKYVQVPLMLTFGTRVYGKRVVPYDDIDPYVDFHVMAGAYFGYFLGGTESGNYRTTYRDIDETTQTDTTYPPEVTPVKGDLKEGIAKIDYGLITGFGFTFNLGYSNQIIFSALYSRGFANVNEKRYAVPDKITGKPNYFGLYNQVFSFNLSYVVRIGG